MKLYGIDISQHNVNRGTINWKRVYDSGVRFVMIRAGWAGYQGEMHFDPSFQESARNASAAGISVGLYVYSYALSAAAARRAARETCEKIRGLTVEYPIAFDVEDPLLTKQATRAQITGTVVAFCQEVQALGYYALFYTYQSFTREYLDMNRLKAFDFWLAEYTASPTFQGHYGIWQYEGNDGTCPGVTGPCDRNIAYQDYEAIIRRAGLNHLERAPEETGRSITVEELRRQNYKQILL